MIEVTVRGNNRLWRLCNGSLEAKVDFDPNDAPRYLEGVEYPASKGDLVSGELVERIGTLGRPSFESADEVVAELEASPTSG